jgi:acetyltransferase-like isoleucine patch superfamily enzyme
MPEFLKRLSLALSSRIAVGVLDRIYGAEALNLLLRISPMQIVPSILRSCGAAIGENVRFRSPLVIHNSDIQRTSYYKNLCVGSNCYFGRELFLDLQDRIVVEDNVTISHRVMILTHTDAGDSPVRDTSVPTSCAPVVICTGAYIGANVTILQGIEIGSNAVVGAGAVVTRSIPPFSVAVGVPARARRVAGSSLETDSEPTARSN